MTKRRHRLWDTSTNRCLTDAEVAFYLGMSASAFAGKRPALEGAGFPPKDQLTSRTDKALIDRWLDARGGLLALSASDQADEALERWDASR